MQNAVARIFRRDRQLVGFRPGRTAAAAGWLLMVAGLAGLAAILTLTWHDPEGLADEQTVSRGRLTHAGDGTPIQSLAYSPDGEYVTAATIGGEVRLKRVPDGPWFTISRGPGKALGSARCVAFPRDGRSLAAVGWSNELRSWRLPDGAEADPINLETDFAICIAFSSDGKTMAVGGGEKRALALWDWTTRRPLNIFEGQKSSVNTLAFSADGTLLASGDVSGHVVIWEVAAGRALVRFPAHKGPVSSLTFSPDGSRLVTSAFTDPACKVWDAVSGSSFLSLGQASSGVTAAAYSPDGTMIAASNWGNQIEFWDSETGQPLRSIAFPRTIYAMAFSTDGKTLAIGSHDSCVRFSDVTNLRSQRRVSIADARTE